MSAELFYEYLDDGVSFRSRAAAKSRTIYAPLCGPDAVNLKAAITPFLSGDVKIDKFRYLTRPVSTEDLRYDLRNFFAHVEGQGIFCLTKETFPGSAQVEIGQFWHRLVRRHPGIGLSMTATSVIPANGDNVEVTYIVVENTSENPVTLTPTSCYPLFCRALANKHDHEHVTSLLNRVRQLPQGVMVRPTMKFDEQGHHPNEDVYFAFGAEEGGVLPVGSFPTAESFFGDGGSAGAPQAVARNARPLLLEAALLNGKEAVGALRFAKTELAPGQAGHYFLVSGIMDGGGDPVAVFEKYNSREKFGKVIRDVETYWRQKSTAIEVCSGDRNFDRWMRWVTVQPVLRRIFGCSFLPDHDYGKGGKGWRDIWQDLLSLILIEPDSVREALLNNFAGVRIDGSNATIIGELPGSFLADRNAITRVWMDHGVWPLMTVLWYINQTGDYGILFESRTYFRDPQQSRTLKKDRLWAPGYGAFLKTKEGRIHRGTVLEHLLVQNLTQFFNVGAHNCIRLESADWNDGLDMAFERGESVAFTSAYAGNLASLADVLRRLESGRKVKVLAVAKELLILLDTLSGRPCDYDSVAAKTALFFDAYCPAVEPELSGETVDLEVAGVVRDLDRKALWIREHLRNNEKVTVDGLTWYNGYYDNQSRRVEGRKDGRVRMTLTGQVFPVMSGVATDEDLALISRSVNEHLRDKDLGGFRLNTDFGVPHYLDLGRAFGFAYGTKENGAFFSHMAVMYAFALYSRGLAREGFAVLDSIYRMSADADRSRIYPGIPEYLDSLGQGRYHYLTGSASWYVLTLLTQAFGVRGCFGDLELAPKLVAEQFDNRGAAAIHCCFAGKRLEINYENPQGLDFGGYRVTGVFVENRPAGFTPGPSGSVIIPRAAVAQWPATAGVKVVLG